LPAGLKKRDNIVVLTGKQKAAMLLMSLDPPTATELLRGLNPDAVQELAIELAHLDASGFSGKESTEIARQFYNSLKTNQEFHFNSLLKQMLKKTLNEEKTINIQTQTKDSLNKRDPFMFIRSVDSQTIASTLKSEHPQTAAIVLSGLPVNKSSEVIGLLSEGIRISVIGRMSSCETMTAEAKTRIAEIVCKRLEMMTADEKDTPFIRPESPQNNIVMILRKLAKKLRDSLIGTINRKNNRVDNTIANLNIIWEEIPLISDISLQEALREIELKKLALALEGADDILVQKIKTNISEETSATLDKEISATSAPKKDVQKARDAIVHILQKMDKKGKLKFIEEQYYTVQNQG
jgi:flagellar motor switch protein FliG